MKKLCFILLLVIASNSYCNDKISKDKLESATSLTDFLQTPNKSLFKVISYNVFYQPKGGDAEIVSNEGAVFNDKVKKLISRAKSGDIYYIEEIKVVGPDGMTRKIPDITFRIN